MEQPNVPNSIFPSPLRKALSVIEHLERELSGLRRSANEPIAVVGMGCRFPGGASNPQLYWESLCNGVDAVSSIPEDRWPVEPIYSADRNLNGHVYTRYGSFLREVSEFDADFFGISPTEARSLDPQHRLLLEVTWEALEHGAIASATLRNSQTGVFIGIGQNDYAQLLLNAGDLNRITRFDGTGNGFCFAPGRISHTFGLRGPSVAIDCACSSSLVAVHLACQSLRSRECDLALAGGVQLILSPEVTVFLCRAGALAPDGRCKAFDAAADGFGRGEGCGLVVLKRLSDARAAGDHVWGIIRGSAVNHDGVSSGLTVPSVSAQIDLLSRALAVAEVQPAAVGYVEAHGTGTLLGDPIEVEALGNVYCKSRPAKSPLRLASVKSNHGHLEAAAGVAGLIKTLLSLHYGKLPPHLHLRKPNPHIPWDLFSLRIPTEVEEWSAETARVAGVSSFGFGGTNAHVIVEATTSSSGAATHASGPSVLLLSARSELALRQLAARYAEHMERNPDLAIGDVCRTAAAGRDHFPYRLAIKAESRETVCLALRGVAGGAAPANVRMGKLSSDQVQAHNRDVAATFDQVAVNYVNGVPIDWARWFPKQGRAPVVLPTYPFLRQPFWIEKPRITSLSVRDPAKSKLEPDESVDLYKVCWNRAADVASRTLLPSSGQWIVLCDGGGVGDALVEELRKQGRSCACVRRGVTNRRIAVNEYSIAPSDPSVFDRLLRELVQTRPEPIAGIVHCWSCDIDSFSRSHGDYLDIGCLSALRLFRSLRQYEANPSPRVWLLTCGSQDLDEHPAGGNPFQAMLWGFGRSISLQWPDLWGGLHDVSTTPDRREIARLVDELLCHSFDQVAWRGEEAWIPSLRRQTQAKAARINLKPDGAYLVTGGWGAIGLRVGKWLAKRGARLVVLTGRRQPPSLAIEAAEALESHGACVWLRSSNVSDLEATRHLVREIDNAGFCLRGVFHAAGTGGQSETDSLSDAQFREVCSAKVEGAWNLHEITCNRELDHFVLFSSIASVWGSKRQVHYSAASEFLDALARLRSRLGLPALSVNWGPWAGGGLTDEAAQSSLEGLGIFAVSPDSALDALETLIANERSCQAVAVDANWQRLASFFSALPRRRFFDEVAGHSERIEEQRIASVVPLHASEFLSRREQLEQQVSDILAELLGYSANRRPDPQCGFSDLGMDSVMAIDFRNRIQREFGAPMPATLAFDFPNLDRLVSYLENTLFETCDSEDSASKAACLAHDDDDSSLATQIEDRLTELETLLYGPQTALRNVDN
jgi:acyl transferase domain-containing protein/acyl carrier protein